ncbi:MAG TPA: helix-turn-helix transcriptional regulator [Solirubrobacteraceae bacterium]|nr:helix-turn-helix transcriptional regulator [Solirubrobacteraceae bacterium]
MALGARSPLLATVGENVAALRRSRGLSAGELARRAGIGKATLSEIESGRRNTTLETLHALTRALGTSLGTPLVDVTDGVVAGDGVRAHLAARHVDRGGVTELYRVRIHAGSPPHLAAHAPGLLKTAIVFRGALLVAAAGTERRLEAGQSGQWAAEEPETYTALGALDVEASLLLRYSRQDHCAGLV